MRTVDPPVVRLLPFASLARTVRTWVDDPLAVIEELTGVSVDWAASADRRSVVEGERSLGSRSWGEGGGGVWSPSASTLPPPIVPVPEDLVMRTVDPPVVRLLPFASLARTVRTWVDDPLAVIEELTGVSVDWAAS